MSNFVDECALNVRGGDGGAGCVSFRREAHVERGGPDGGDGGSGGSVWLVADHNVASLLAFRDHPHRRASSGTHGSGKKKHGSGGDDTIVLVPVGTTVRDADDTIVADLAESGARWQAARGGVGGRGNARFLSNRRRAPSFAEQGEHGEEQWIRLELKLLADVALVGFPNAGKSTLISSISAAKPKIADYPFTTLEPNLGVVRSSDDEFVAADIPGLIEGAADGRGLGHQFLRHIERARVLAVLLDPVPYDGQGQAEQLDVLLGELGAYRPELLERPRVIVGTKADIAPEARADIAPEARADIAPEARADIAPEAPVDGAPEATADGAHAEFRVDITISAVTGLGLTELVGMLATKVREARDAEVGAPVGYLVHRPEPTGLRIERDEEGAFIVRGRSAERAVALNDLTNMEAIDYVQARLKSLGVDRALVRAGARDGDTVMIGEFVFDYRDDGLGSIGYGKPARRR